MGARPNSRADPGRRETAREDDPRLGARHDRIRRPMGADRISRRSPGCQRHPGAVARAIRRTPFGIGGRGRRSAGRACRAPRTDAQDASGRGSAFSLTRRDFATRAGSRASARAAACSSSRAARIAASSGPQRPLERTSASARIGASRNPIQRTDRTSMPARFAEGDEHAVRRETQSLTASMSSVATAARWRRTTSLRSSSRRSRGRLRRESMGRERSTRLPST